MYYQQNRLRARTTNTEPTLTDQSAARETDLNIIITQMLKTGQGPGAATAPIFGDFTLLPTDLRGLIDLARSMHQHREQLPEPLRALPLEQLITSTDQQLAAILKPQAPATQEEPK